MAKSLSANCRCAKTRNSKALASKPQYFPPEKIFIKGASSEGRIFLRGKKTTNFERIAHLNTEFDGPKVAHFNAWKTEKNGVISFQNPSESNRTAHSFPIPLISSPEVHVRSSLKWDLKIPVNKKWCT